MAFITRLSLRLGVVVLLGVVLLFGAGIFAATQVQQDLLPDISVPAVIIITPYPGASPEIVDQQVSVPVVNAMLGVTGTTTVQSTSSQGASLLIVLFRDGTDLKSAEQDVNSALARIRQLLPPQAASSSVQTFSTNSLPILEYAISANESLGDLAGQLRAQALPKLKGLAGVSSVVLTGAPTDEVDVTVDPIKMAAHGLTVTQVAAALQQASIVQSVGSLKQGSATIPLQVSGSLTSLDQIGKVTVTPPLGTQSGGKPAAPVSINQLGTVQVASIPSDTITRTNGKPSIGLQIVKGPNTNTVTVANEVWSALPGIESSIGHGVRMDSIQDQSTPITQAIGNILREGLLGAVFAVLVIFVFLRSARATVVAAISIPLSLLVALIALWSQGITLNILTLGGMMVAIGRVVDDSIVVLENISRHVSEGERPLVAAYTGAREIITAVASSTATTVAVFLPIVFLTGIAGSFFRPFALTVVVALLASLVVAVTVVPLLASRLLPAIRAEGAERRLRWNWTQRVYVPVIQWATSHRLLTLGAAAAFFAASMALIPLLRVNLLDQSSSPTFPVAITMPVNSTLSETDSEAQKVEALIAGVPGITAYQATVGGQGGPFAGAAPADPSQGSVLVLVQNGQYDNALAGVKRALNAYKGPAKLLVGQAQNSANASSSQMQVDVRAGDTATLQAANDQVLAALSKVSGLAELKSNLVVSKPQYQLVPTDKLAASGLNIQTLAALVAQQINGQVATQANLPQGTMIVRVQLPPGTADTAASLSLAADPHCAWGCAAVHDRDHSRGHRPADRQSRQRRPGRDDHGHDHRQRHACGPDQRHQCARRRIASIRRITLDRRSLCPTLHRADSICTSASGSDRARLPDHGCDLPLPAEALGAAGLDSIRGDRRHHRARCHQHVAIAAGSDRNPDAHRHRGHQRHRPARPHRAVPRSRPRLARRHHRGRPASPAPDLDDRLRHHAGFGPAGGARRRRRRWWSVHQRPAGDRSDRRPVHQHAADFGPGPSPLLAGGPLRRTALDQGPG